MKLMIPFIQKNQPMMKKKKKISTTDRIGKLTQRNHKAYSTKRVRIIKMKEKIQDKMVIMIVIPTSSHFKLT